MALFQNEEMVNVQTPDGRTLTLPRSLVPASMQQQIGQSPGPQPNGFADEPPPSFTPPETPSVTGGQMPTEDVQQIAPPPDMAAPVQNAPDYKIGTVDNRPETVAKSNQAYVKQQKAAVAQAASPQGKADAAQAKVQTAIGDQGQATANEADVEAAGQAMTADAYAERNRHLDQMFADRSKQANDDLANVQKKQAEFTTLREKIAKTKIDRKADHPILAAISIALANMGARMQDRNAPLPGLKILMESIDRKVAGQMADLDNQKSILGMQKDEIAQMRETASNRLSLNNLMISGETEKAARHVEEIVARTTSDKVKANGQLLAAQLRERAAGLQEQSAQWQLQFDQRDKFQKQEMGYKYSALGEEKRHNMAGEQLTREQINADLMKALAAERAKNGEASMKQAFEMQKEVSSRGIGDVATGGYILNKAGTEKLAQADAMMKEAQSLRELDAKSPDPAARQAATTRAAALENKASELRGDAYLRDVFMGRDPVQAGKLAEKYAGAQSAINTIDDIKLLYESPDGGKKFFNTDTNRAAVQSLSTQLMMQLKQAWQLGVLSKQDINTISQATGGADPQAWDGEQIANIITNSQLGKDPEAFITRLEKIADKVQDSTLNEFRTNKYDGDAKSLFHRKTAPENSPERQAVKGIQGEQTPLEAENAARSGGSGVTGAVRTGVQKVFYGTSPDEEANKAASSGGSLQYPGLSQKQGDEFASLVQAYKSGSNPRAGQQLIALATQPNRPELGVSMMHVLRDAAPDLYTQARTLVKPDTEVGKQLDQEEKQRIAVTDVPTSILLQQYNVTKDPEARAEIARRATNGDKEAQKAAVDLVFETRYGMMGQR